MNYNCKDYTFNKFPRVRYSFVIIVTFLILVVFTGVACKQKGTREMAIPGDANDVFDRRYLAVDQTLHTGLRNVKMEMGQAGNDKVIFEESVDVCEKINHIGSLEYCSVIRDHEGRFRLYYNVRKLQPEQREMMAVAFSDDGVNWVKPALNIAPALVDHPSSNLINVKPHPGMSNEYYYRSGPVFYDAHAPKESRYKLSWRVHNDMYVASSSDGLNFITHGLAIHYKGDTQHAAFYDFLKGEYVMYGRKRGDWETGYADRRGVPRHSSRNWTDIPWTNIGEVVIDPMDIWDYSTGIWPQVYTPSIQIYHGQYIGLPSIFYTDSKRIPVPRPDKITGPFFPMFMYSHDGIQWTFPDLSHPIIDIEPHERISTYEHASFKGKEVGMICTAANFIEVGDSLYIYYTARNANHYEPCLPNQASINVAFIRVDGFASIRTTNTNQTGEWITSDLKVPSGAGNLHVNADVAGNLRVEVLNAETDKPIKGLGLANSLGVTGNKTNFIMKWKGGTFKNASGRDIRLRFMLDDGAIHSFFFQPR